MLQDGDEGFARNLNKIFGNADLYRGMGGKPLASVELSGDGQSILFTFTEGSIARFGVQGDCCSRSWIEHLDVAPSAIGQEIVDVVDNRVSSEDRDGRDGLLQVYKTTFRTLQGDIVLEYRNESNGYYGGYLVRLD